MYFAPLDAADAARIARLQRKRFRRELTEPVAEIRTILENADAHAICNLSFGLFDGTRLVGYVFAYIESRSVFHERVEEVVYLKEIVLNPGYEAWLRPMIRKLLDRREAYGLELPLEAHAEEGAMRNWQRLARMMRRYGLRMSWKEGRETKTRYWLMRADVDAPEILRPTPLPAAAWTSDEGVSVTVLTDPREWRSLEETWAELLRATPGSNVFQSFEYLWEWWQCLGAWNALRILVFRRGDDVIGAAPLMLEYFPVLGRVMRKLQFLTTPMEMNRPMLLFGRHGDACLNAFLGWLDAHPDEWEMLDLDEQVDGEQAAAIRRHVRDRRLLYAESRTICPYIEVRGSWNDFLKGLSRRMRSNVNRTRRRMADEGSVEVRLEPCFPDADEALERFCEVEERSWKAERNLHLAGDGDAYCFYLGLARRFGADGRFQMRMLECDGKPVAATFGILHEGTFQSLKIAHDRAYDRLSPGTVLESYELEALFASGIGRYEFMGSFLANKLRWTSTVLDTVNMHIYRRQPRLVLFWFFFFVLKRRVKALLKKTGQFERVDRLLARFRSNPFPRY